MIVIDDEISDRSPIAIFVADDEARIACWHADRAEAFIWSSQEIESRNVAVHIVLDQRQEIAELDKVRGRVWWTDGTRSGEPGVHGAVVVKPAVSGALNDRGLAIARRALHQMECLA